MQPAPITNLFLLTWQGVHAGDWLLRRPGDDKGGQDQVWPPPALHLHPAPHTD